METLVLPALLGILAAGEGIAREPRPPCSSLTIRARVPGATGTVYLAGYLPERLMPRISRECRTLTGAANSAI